jgi:hypothetical protein
MRIKGLTLAAVVALLAGGCLTVGREFDSRDLSWIEPNRTTRDTVHERLGEPFRLGVDSGKVTWTYGYYKYRVFGTTCTKDLVIYLNRDGTVSTYTFSTSYPDEKEVWKNRTAP